MVLGILQTPNGVWFSLFFGLSVATKSSGFPAQNSSNMLEVQHFESQLNICLEGVLLFKWHLFRILNESGSFKDTATPWRSPRKPGGTRQKLMALGNPISKQMLNESKRQTQAWKSTALGISDWTPFKKEVKDSVFVAVFWDGSQDLRISSHQQ